jgi:hypothetical protein
MKSQAERNNDNPGARIGASERDTGQTTVTLGRQIARLTIPCVAA